MTTMTARPQTKSYRLCTPQHEVFDVDSDDVFARLMESYRADGTLDSRNDWELSITTYGEDGDSSVETITGGVGALAAFANRT